MVQLCLIKWLCGMKICRGVYYYVKVILNLPALPIAYATSFWGYTSLFMLGNLGSPQAHNIHIESIFVH